MKKILFAVLVSTFINSAVHAQEVKIGAKGGLNLSTITANSETVTPRLAYHFGAFLNLPLSEKLSLHPEMLYFSIGHINSFDYGLFRGADPSLNGSFKSVERSNYLAVPINFRYNFSKKFGLDFGPQVSFLLNGVLEIKESNSFTEESNKRKTSGKFRPDYGVNLGLTFTPVEKINFQLRFYQSLHNLLGGSIFDGDSGVYNIALQFSVGYVIF
ncbi:MAG: porin family protein [Maribacter sp.]